MDLKNIYKDIDLKILNIDDDSHIRNLLIIRNESFVRNFMFNNKIINIDDHYKWVKSNIKNKTRIFYLVFYQHSLIGSVILSNISYENKRTDWAFYISEHSIKGIGAAIEFKFINMLFNDNNFEKLNCEVLNFNQTVIKLHQKFGFDIEGIRKNHIYRDNKYLDCTLLALTLNKWKSIIYPSLKKKFLN